MEKILKIKMVFTASIIDIIRLLYALKKFLERIKMVFEETDPQHHRF